MQDSGIQPDEILPRPAPSARCARVLYLSYDGMCDPLGGSQVLPYLFGLAKRGHDISLISFEKPKRTSEERAAVEQACTAAGIHWHPLPYHGRPPVLSAMVDVRRMRRLAQRLHRERDFDLVHCRSFLPALVGLRMKRRDGVRFIFDMRGFWADERVESGAWDQRNPIFRAVYRYFKSRERVFWQEADEIISLTHEGKRVIRSARAAGEAQPPITVIPCCVDFDAFPAIDAGARAAARERLGIGADERVLGYIGSLGGTYMHREMLDFFSAYRQRCRSAKFLFVTHVPEAFIRAAAAERGVPDSTVIIRAASRAEVPQLMAAADCGVAFKQASFSAKACSPTKLGEMLALEIPVVANSGVGDVDRIIAEAGAGVVVDRFDRDAFVDALNSIDRLEPQKDKWRAATRRWFDLEGGVDLFDRIYRWEGNIA